MDRNKREMERKEGKGGKEKERGRREKPRKTVENRDFNKIFISRGP